MHRILFSFVLILSIVKVKGQEYNYKWHIYTSPLECIDPFSFSRLTIGTEYTTKSNLGFALEFGVKNKFNEIVYGENTFEGEDLIKEFGYTFRTEFKIYDQLHFLKKSRFRDYLGFEYRYLKHHFNDHNEYYLTSEEDLSSAEREKFDDYFGVRKNIQIANIKYGVIVNLGKCFYLDAFSGFGIRFKDIENVNRTYNPQVHTIDNGPHDFVYRTNLEEDSHEHFNFSLGVKLGVRF